MTCQKWCIIQLYFTIYIHNFCKPQSSQHHYQLSRIILLKANALFQRFSVCWLTRMLDILGCMFVVAVVIQYYVLSHSPFFHVHGFLLDVFLRIYLFLFAISMMLFHQIHNICKIYKNLKFYFHISDIQLFPYLFSPIKFVVYSLKHYILYNVIVRYSRQQISFMLIISRKQQ